MGPRFGQKLDEKFVFFAPLLDPPKDPVRDPRGCRARHPDRPARGRRPGRPAGGPDGPTGRCTGDRFLGGGDREREGMYRGYRERAQRVAVRAKRAARTY